MVQALEVTVEPENMVASHLEGRWLASPILNRLLGQNRPDENSFIVEFIPDETVLNDLPQHRGRGRMSSELTIYMAGRAVVGEQSFLFYLTEIYGNPQLVLHKEWEDGVTLGASTIFNTMLVAGRERNQDLLFLSSSDPDDPGGMGLVRLSPSPSCCAMPEAQPQTSPQR